MGEIGLLGQWPNEYSNIQSTHWQTMNKSGQQLDTRGQILECRKFVQNAFVILSWFKLSETLLERD